MDTNLIFGFTVLALCLVTGIVCLVMAWRDMRYLRTARQSMATRSGFNSGKVTAHILRGGWKYILVLAAALSASPVYARGSHGGSHSSHARMSHLTHSRSAG